MDDAIVTYKNDGENVDDRHETDNYKDSDEDVDAPWAPVPPKKEKHGIWTVIWVLGTPFEMGFQQGQLLHDEIAYGIKNSQYVKDVKQQINIAALAQVDKYAKMNSYPDIIQECEGMVTSAGDVGWTMELCLFINFGDVMVELLDSLPGIVNFNRPGCSQMMVTDNATVDGRLYHARMLDWAEIDYFFWYPTIIVRQSVDGLPRVYIGFPGNLSPYSGMNVAGISAVSNESDPVDSSQQAYTGRSHVQMLGQVLKHSENFEDAISFVEGEKHMVATQFGIADADNNTAGVFEMTAKNMAVRKMKEGVLWVTNHFVDPLMKDFDAEPIGESSRRRYDRFSQLVPEQEFKGFSLGTLLNWPGAVSVDPEVIP